MSLKRGNSIKNTAYGKGVLMMIASSALFSCTAVLIRSALAIDPFKTALFRFAIGMAILCTLALVGRIKLRFINVPLLIVRGVSGGLAVFLFYLSINRIGLAKGTVISNMYPIFATIGGAIVLKEHVKPVAWFFVFACIAGIVLVNHNAESGKLTIDVWTVLAFAGSLVSAVAIVSVRRLARTDSPYAIFMSQCLFGFWIVVLPANLLPMKLGLTGGLILLAIGIIAAIGQLMMTWSFAHVDVATGSLLSMLMVVFNVIIGTVFFSEERSVLSIVGMVVITLSCTGIVYVNRKRPVIIDVESD